MCYVSILNQVYRSFRIWFNSFFISVILAMKSSDSLVQSFDGNFGGGGTLNNRGVGLGRLNIFVTLRHIHKIGPIAKTCPSVLI
jgi:hypothetical protein